MTDTPSLRATFGAALRIALPYFRSQERWVARTLLAGIIGMQLGGVGIAVATNYWRNAFFQTLQDKNWPGFVTQFQIFCVIGVGFILTTVYQRYLTQWLSIRWRRWLTTQCLDGWLDGPAHYRAALAAGIDNPDQRVADDVRSFIDETLALSIGLIGAVASFVSFVAILWSLSDLVPLTLFGTTWAIPGYLVWAALLYAVLGSIATHAIGWRLVPADYEQERREADFRFALVRIREHGESIALLGGERAERQELVARFAALMRNWYRLMRLQQFVSLFAETYRYYSRYFPYLVMAPLFFSGGMALGALMQSGSAFNAVRESFSYFIVSYTRIATLAAIVQRLTQFRTAVDAAAAPARPMRDADALLSVQKLTVAAPGGTLIAALDPLTLRAGDAVLLTGPSGAGKTSIMRAIAGIWPHTTGQVNIAAGSMLVLPQRPYLPLGTLRHAVAYPRDPDGIDRQALRAALDAAGLAHLAGQLDSTDAWAKRLSEGEKQRLSVARAFLLKPDLLLLDEATAALDEGAEIALHAALRRALPRTAILASSHNAALATVYDRTIAVRPAACAPLVERAAVEA